METYAIYFWPRGALASMLGSDTIFGAVCWGIQLLKLADVGQMLEKQFQPPQFAFSSPCPVYRRGEKRLRFYPRPAWLHLEPAEVEQLAQEMIKKNQRLNLKRALERTSSQAKRFKKLEYLSEDLFREVVEGRLSSLSFCQRLLEPNRAGNNESQIEQVRSTAVSYKERYVVHPESAFDQPLFAVEAVQHNQIDRVAGATAEGFLFYDQEIFFGTNAGLWCLVKTERATMDKLIRPALRYLADTGLGANRTAGKGQFEIEVEAAPPLPDAGAKANGLVMLSRYLPAAGEWSAAERPLAYELVNLTAKREQKFARASSGQRTPPIYKQGLRMLEPGCVVPHKVTADIYGRLAVVVPDEGDGRQTWQSGLAIGLRARVEVKND